MSALIQRLGLSSHGSLSERCVLRLRVGVEPTSRPRLGPSTSVDVVRIVILLSFLVSQAIPVISTIGEQSVPILKPDGIVFVHGSPARKVVNRFVETIWLGAMTRISIRVPLPVPLLQPVATHVRVVSIDAAAAAESVQTGSATSHGWAGVMDPNLVMTIIVVEAIHEIDIS